MPIYTISTQNETVNVTASALVIQSGTLTDSQALAIQNLPADTNAVLATKVDEVPNKGLSTNDYDDTEKAKVTAAGTHAANVSNPHSVSKSQVGLGNVDNTSDADKPVSTAQQAAIDLKANLTDIPDVENTQYLGGWNATTNIASKTGLPISDATGSNAQFYIVDVGGTIDLGGGDQTFVAGGRAYHNGSIWEPKDPPDAVASVAGKTGVVTLVKGDVGLGSVDNTSDANKPVSIAGQTALDLKLTTSSAKVTLELDQVDNTSDENKPVSTAQAAADAAVQALIPTTTTPLTDTPAKRFVSDLQISGWNSYTSTVVTRNITDTQIKGLAGVGYANGIELEAAPSLGNETLINTIFSDFTFVSGEYDESDFVVGFSDDDIVLQTNLSGSENNSFTGFAGKGSTALRFFARTGVPGSGDGTLKIKYTKSTTTI